MSNRELPFPMHEHAIMLGDRTRMSLIKQAIKEYANPTASFLELGCGTGAFTIYAAQHYAHAVGVERDESVIEFGRGAAANSIGHQSLDLICSDLFDFAERFNGTRFDVIFSELLSPWILREPQFSAFEIAKQYLLKPGGQLIPSAVVFSVEVGIFDFDFEGIPLKSHHYDFHAGSRFQALTLPGCVARIEFQQTKPAPPTHGEVLLQVLLQGPANAVRIHTGAQLSPSVVLWGTPSIMPSVIYPLEKPLFVSPDEQPRLLWQMSLEGGLESASFSLDRT